MVCPGVWDPASLPGHPSWDVAFRIWLPGSWFGQSQVAAACAGSHGYLSCGFPAWIQRLLPWVLLLESVGCSWEGAWEQESTRRTNRAPLEQPGTVHPSPDPSSPCKGQDGKVRDETPEPLQSPWLLAETAN